MRRCFFFRTFFAPVTGAQFAIEPIDNRQSFNSASTNVWTIDFSSVAPHRGFGMHRAPAGLTTNGVTFRTAGGARFGSGIIYVPSLDYMGTTNSLYQTGTGEMISWSVPNQPGNASLDVTLPSGVTAVGADLWTQQPYVSTVEVSDHRGWADTNSRRQNTEPPRLSFCRFHIRQIDRLN